MVRLTEDVYLVGGSPSHGFGLSEEMDSHVYLIDGGAELALVDCGMARDGSLDRIAENIHADGLDPAVRAVEAADPDATGFALARDAGIYPVDYEVRPADVQDKLADGDVRRVGELEVEVVATPGHCRGHSAYRLVGRARTHLFTGDCVFFGGEISLLNTADSHLAAYRVSVLRLVDVEFDALLPGHGAVCIKGGRNHVAQAAAAFRSLSLPRNHG